MASGVGTTRSADSTREHHNNPIISQRSIGRQAEGITILDVDARHSHGASRTHIEVQLPSGVQLRISCGIESLEAILTALQRSVA